MPSHVYLLGMVASSTKLVEVSLKLDVTAEDADEDASELLDKLATLLDDELEDDELEELGALLDERLDELGVSVALELLPPEEPPQAVSNKNDKHKMVLTNFMANTCCCYEY